MSNELVIEPKTYQFSDGIEITAVYNAELSAQGNFEMYHFSFTLSDPSAEGVPVNLGGKSFCSRGFIEQRKESPKDQYWYHWADKGNSVTDVTVPDDIKHGTGTVEGWTRFCETHGISHVMGDSECTYQDDDSDSSHLGATWGYDPITEFVYKRREGLLLYAARRFRATYLQQREIALANEALAANAAEIVVVV